MGRFTRGSEAILKAAEGSKGQTGLNTWPLRWGDTAKDNRKFLQFLTPLEEIATVQMHEWIITGYREDGKPIYQTFVSRRDPAYDGPAGYDPIADRFNVQPKSRCIAVAVELEAEFTSSAGKRKITGFAPKMREWKDREGVTHTEPVVAFVIQAAVNFFRYLPTWVEESGADDITSTIFSVTKSGSNTDVNYQFVALPHDPVDTSDLTAPDIEAYLDKHADLDRLKTMIDPLADDFKITSFPPKKGPAKPQRRVIEEPDPEDSAENGMAFVSNEEKNGQSKFDRFRERVETEVQD